MKLEYIFLGAVGLIMIPFLIVKAGLCVLWELAKVLWVKWRDR